MTLGTQIVDALRRLAAEGPQAAGALVWDEQERRIGVAAADAHARLDLADYDRYSVTLRALEVSLAPRAAAEDPHAELSGRAAAVIRRLAYLEEPLAVWELDGRELAAQLRSSPPQREGEELTYWEITLRTGEQPLAHAARYRWAPGMAEREAVVYPATFALIGRIADSLAAALAE